jgi:hypothetical protein
MTIFVIKTFPDHFRLEFLKDAPPSCLAMGPSQIGAVQIADEFRPLLQG